MLKVPPEFFSDIFVIHIGKKLCYTMSFLYSLQIMDSELMHSIVGSYLKPPERVCVPSVTLGLRWWRWGGRMGKPVLHGLKCSRLSGLNFAFQTLLLCPP